MRPAMQQVFEAAALYLFKQAETREEFEQIHRLNYRTFVDEVGQYASDGSGVLVDSAHERNTYLIALREGRVVGMVAVQDQRPFSIEKRLADTAVLEELGPRLLEVRLLAIEPAERLSRVFAGLLYQVYEFARRRGDTHLLISGVEEKLSIYTRLGFKALGPAVPAGKTSFTPMAAAVADLPAAKVKTFRRQALYSTPRHCTVSLLPGPVQISLAVREALARPPISHRGQEFLGQFAEVRKCLSEMAGGAPVALFPGSGTLANDVVAAALAQKACGGEGLVLVNGEFGARLAGQARRWRIPHHEMTWNWGEPWDLDRIDQFLKAHPRVSFVWGVHLETSTGVLNDLNGLRELVFARGVALCLDCVSSFGAVPIDMRRVSLATAVSGKSLGSYAGISFVFADPGTLDTLGENDLPSCLDLQRAIHTDGPLFTFASPLVGALHTALRSYATSALCQQQYTRYDQLGQFVRQQLRLFGLAPLTPEKHAAPVITTFAPTHADCRAAVLERCSAKGFQVAGESQYLVDRDWLQIATMGRIAEEEIAPVFPLLLPSGCR